MDLSSYDLVNLTEPTPNIAPPAGIPAQNDHVTSEAQWAHVARGIVDGIRRVPGDPDASELMERYDMLAAPGSLLDSIRDVLAPVEDLDANVLGEIVGVSTSVGLALGMRGFTHAAPDVVLAAVRHVVSATGVDPGRRDAVWFAAYTHLWAAARVEVPTYLAAGQHS